MTAAAMVLATARFALWETALFAASARIARWLAFRGLLGILAIEIALEASIASLFSFSHLNSPAAYWIAAAIAAAYAIAPAILAIYRPTGRRPKPQLRRPFAAAPYTAAAIAALTAPLILLAFHPVDEIDSINHLHYMIDWMANRSIPYTFATNYVAFWELSFLPAWIVTGIDGFFPLLALKAVVLLALAAILVGRELGLRARLLAWTVFGAIVMRYFWVDFSGVGTLKNDALHGAGFALLTLAMIRAAKLAPAATLARADFTLLALGASFASVKYTGIFLAVFAIGFVWLFARSWRWPLAVFGVLLATSGHYYLHNWLANGSPFYPFRINLGPIHLPGTADLSDTSILYSLRYPEVWRAFFLPAGGLSPIGVLFPAILVAGFGYSFWQCARWAAGRSRPSPIDVAALMALLGWLLYFRSVYSASGWPGDLSYIRNGLASMRYVDGVLTVTELLLVAAIARFEALAAVLVSVGIASRLIMLYARIPGSLYSLETVFGAASAAAIIVWALARSGRRVRLFIVSAGLAAASLVLLSPILVEHSRPAWMPFWMDMKPDLAAVRGPGLAELALPDSGYFAGHAVAAGNPVDARVRSFLLEELPAHPPRYLALLLMPGSPPAGIAPSSAAPAATPQPDWKVTIAPKLAALGYEPVREYRYGAMFELRTVLK